ncbi:uncharacterized protein CANTADRAFT_38546, partial [Suhomyces tanzawaensis NRRL Y-17324]
INDSLPISCVSCRRKKIKCNKLKPCNQCIKRSIPCHFPSTFRNIQINEDDLTSFDNEDLKHILSSNLRQELELFRVANLQLIESNNKLQCELNKLSTRLEGSNTVKDTKESSNKGIEISGETTEEGEKYYGPQSSSFMIESLKRQKSGSEESQSQPPVEARPEKHNLVEQSLAKKRLPPLLYALHRFDDPDISSDSETWADLQKQNFNVLVKLVNLFFDNNRYYETFISRTKVFEFLHSYQDIKDMEWENDDDLLLFYMILLLSLQKLTPSEFIELNLIPQPAIQALNKFKNYLSKNVLYHSFEKLRHNLLNESIITVQAYILCTEWYFIEQRYEECWSMMFHCCGIAYSIGLHVMGQFRSINSTSKNNDLNDEDDEEMDIFRFKVFFALKSLTGQICSILGRPNPISIQVNSIVLKSSPLSSNQSNINMNKNKTQALLKIGLSECLRLSNSMLIENFMIDFTIDDLLNLNKKFEQEIELLEWFISDEYLSDEEESKDNEGDLLKIDKTNILMDLIVLHINKAKLFEPFVNKFEKIDQYDLIIKNLIHSILKFLELLNYFIENFLNMFVEKYFHYHTRLGGSDLSELIDDNFGKLFRIYFPFLNSSIYQGIIVVFTFLHYKFQEFVVNKDKTDTMINNEFLKLLELNFNSLLNFDRRISGILNSITKLWPSNVAYLMHKVLKNINQIYERQNCNEEANDHLNSQFNDDQSNFEFTQLYGFHLNDPFWITNPENLPHYLSSPSDEATPKSHMNRDSKNQSST